MDRTALTSAAEQWIAENPNEEDEARLHLDWILQSRATYLDGLKPEEAPKRVLHMLQSALCLETRSRPALTMAAPLFNPVTVDLNGIDTKASADVWKTRFKAALPTAAQAVMDSRSHQEPIVFITNGRTNIWPNVASLFLHYESEDCEEGMPLRAENGADIGCEVLGHIDQCWSSVEPDGKPMYSDGDYVPSCKVVKFRAFSAVHAYFRVIMGIADGGTWEDVRGASTIMTPLDQLIDFDPEDCDEDEIEASRNTDYETDCLFLHFAENNLLYVATVKLRDLVADAQQWVMGNSI